MRKKPMTLEDIRLKYGSYANHRNTIIAFYWLFFFLLFALCEFFERGLFQEVMYQIALVLLGCVVCMVIPIRRDVACDKEIDIEDILSVGDGRYSLDCISEIKLHHSNGGRLTYSEFLFVHYSFLGISLNQFRLKSALNDLNGRAKGEL